MNLLIFKSLINEIILNFAKQFNNYHINISILNSGEFFIENFQILFLITKADLYFDNSFKLL